MDLTAWTEAQRAVIGSVLIDPEHVAGLVFSQARREHFGDAAMRHIFDAARGLWNERKPVDAVTVLAAAGEQYEKTIRSVMLQTPTAANIDTYLHMIADAAKLNAIQHSAAEIMNCRSTEEAAAIYERLGQALRDTEAIEDVTLSEAISDYLDRMGDKCPPDYLKFGIGQLDNILHVSPGKFVIMAADSSVGKTALALQFAYHIASTGKRVGFFSLETDKESLTDRLMAEAQVAGVALPRTKAKDLTEKDWRNATNAGRRADTVPLRLIRKANTIEQIRGRTIQRNFDVIFIDYVQLIDAAGKERWDIVTNVSIGLHRMAQELGVTVIGLSQITPPSKDAKKAPSKDDLRESRQLKHDADAILIMSISSEGAGVFRELQVAKNKDGPLGRMLLDFDAQAMTFTYRPQPQGNPYKEVAKAAKKAARDAIQGQTVFHDVKPGEADDNPFEN